MGGTLVLVRSSVACRRGFTTSCVHRTKLLPCILFGTHDFFITCVSKDGSK